MILAMAATLLSFVAGAEQLPAPTVKLTEAERLDQVRAIHGGAGPWAVVGYRIGERALRDLGLPRQSFALLVVHRSPAEVRYACVADGLQAATGASGGKLNLRLEEVAADRLETIVEDRRSGRTLRFRVNPRLAESILDVPLDRLEAEGARVMKLDDAAVFTIEETTKQAKS